MEKEFIPYEQALAMSDLGFDEDCLACYALRHNDKTETALWMNDQWDTTDTQAWIENCHAPLYQQAFRWFREKHNLIFQITYELNGNYAVTFHKTTEEYRNKLRGMIDSRLGCHEQLVDMYSYEEAEIKCLKKLIELAQKEGE
jgi:hypothetical protein